MISPHAWNPYQVRFPKFSRSVEEEMTMQRNLSAVSQYECVESEEFDTVRTYDLDAMQLCLIASVNVTDTTKSRKIAQVDVADVPAANKFVSTERHTSVTPEDLSERWGIGLQQAKVTLKRTTNKIVRSATMTLGRRYRDDRHFEIPDSEETGQPIPYMDALCQNQATDMGKCLLIKVILPLFTDAFKGK